MYHFIGPLELHEVDGVGGDGDEEDAHGVEIEGAPVVLQDCVGVSGQKDDEVDFLSFIG